MSQVLRSLEEETLKVERKHEEFRNSEGFQFARKVEQDSKHLEELVEQRAKVAESESAVLIKKIQELEAKIKELRNGV